MPRTIKVREMRENEWEALNKLSRSQKAEKRLVERATIVLRRSQGDKSVEIAKELSIETDTVTRWVKRFNEQGIEGLQDREGRGRKADYSEHQRGQMMAMARTKPQDLGLPFATWSLSRLRDYLNEQEQLGISRAQLGRILVAEGLRWYQEQSYFTEPPDPQFVEKRGR